MDLLSLLSTLCQMNSPEYFDVLGHTSYDLLKHLLAVPDPFAHHFLKALTDPISILFIIFELLPLYLHVHIGHDAFAAWDRWGRDFITREECCYFVKGY